MKRIGLFIAFLAFLAIVLPSLTAQDAKKDADKTDKKVDAAKGEKGEPAKDDKKDPEKKTEPKKAEKLIYGNKFVTKIVTMGGSSREFSVEIHERDPKKVFDYNKWYAERTQALAKQQFGIRDVNGRNAYQQAVATFQNEAAKRSNNLTTAKPMEVRASDNAKVRTLIQPVEFDDLGNQKPKWTKKEMEERRDKTGLPGFSTDFDALKQGQWVEIYMAKQAPMPKTKAKKKGPADDDPPAAQMTQEFVLIVIRQEGGK